MIRKPKEHSFTLLRSTSICYHLVHIKPCHKLVEIKNLYFLDRYFTPKTWLLQIPNKNFKPKLTREEGDGGDISVWAFFEVHHHLCRPLSRIASHRRPVLDISTPVDHGNYLPIIFIASIYSFFELHLRHCKKIQENKHMNQSE